MIYSCRMWGPFKKERQKGSEMHEISAEDLPSWFEEKKQALEDESAKTIAAYRKILSYHRKELQGLATELDSMGQTHEDFQFSVQRYKDIISKKLQQTADMIELPEDPYQSQSTLRYVAQQLKGDKITQTLPYIEEAYPDKSARIEDSLKKVEDLIDEIRNHFHTYRIAEFSDIRKRIEELQEKQEEKRNLQKDIQRFRESLKELEQKKEHLYADLEEVLRADDGGELQRLQNSVERAEKRIERKDEEMRDFFKPLVEALKVFQEKGYENETILQDYIDRPVETFKKDSNYRILLILDNLKLNIRNGTIHVKDEVTVRKRIVDLTHEKLDEIHGQYAKLERERRYVTEQLESLPVYQEKKDIVDKIEDVSQEAMSVTASIMEKEQIIRNLSMQKLRKELAHKISQSIGIDVSIV